MIALQPSGTSSWLARTRTISGLHRHAPYRSTPHALRRPGIELARAYPGPANQPGFTPHQRNNRARSDGVPVLDEAATMLRGRAVGESAPFPGLISERDPSGC